MLEFNINNYKNLSDIVGYIIEILDEYVLNPVIWIKMGNNVINSGDLPSAYRDRIHYLTFRKNSDLIDSVSYSFLLNGNEDISIIFNIKSEETNLYIFDVLVELDSINKENIIQALIDSRIIGEYKNVSY